jgi:photosystem II stability/assembly factor-like uncharacterized protein
MSRTGNRIGWGAWGASMTRALRPTSLRLRLAVLTLVLAAAALLSACGGIGGSSAPPLTSTENHLHDVLTLRGEPGAVLIATHFGLYRSSDRGHAWAQVAGGPGQQMDGLMTYKLAQSSVDTKRVYCLALPRSAMPGVTHATAGLYASVDSGRTWKLAAAVDTFPTNSVFSIGVSSASGGRVFAIVSALGAAGLYASDDAGAHWRALPKTPAADITGVLGDPAHPGHVYLWSNISGVFSSADDGRTWSAAAGISGAVYALSSSGDIVYAGGDAGLFVSHDAGRHFVQTHARETFSAIAASLSTPATAYALNGAEVYVTTDGGKTWRQAAPTSQHPALVAVDPGDAGSAYIGYLSPIGLDATRDSGNAWQTLVRRTPPQRT